MLSTPAQLSSELAICTIVGCVATLASSYKSITAKKTSESAGLSGALITLNICKPGAACIALLDQDKDNNFFFKDKDNNLFGTLEKKLHDCFKTNLYEKLTMP